MNQEFEEINTDQLIQLIWIDLFDKSEKKQAEIRQTLDVLDAETLKEQLTVKNSKQTFLHYALELRNDQWIKWILQKMDDLNCRLWDCAMIDDKVSDDALTFGEDNQWPFEQAIKSKNKEIIELFLQYNPATNVIRDPVNGYCYQPLRVAAKTGNLEIFKLLVDKRFYPEQILVGVTDGSDSILYQLLEQKGIKKFKERQKFIICLLEHTPTMTQGELDAFMQMDQWEESKTLFANICKHFNITWPKQEADEGLWRDFLSYKQYENCTIEEFKQAYGEETFEELMRDYRGLPFKKYLVQQKIPLREEDSVEMTLEQTTTTTTTTTNTNPLFYDPSGSAQTALDEATWRDLLEYKKYEIVSQQEFKKNLGEYIYDEITKEAESEAFKNFLKQSKCGVMKNDREEQQQTTTTTTISDNMSITDHNSSVSPYPKSQAARNFYNAFGQCGIKRAGNSEKQKKGKEPPKKKIKTEEQSDTGSSPSNSF